MSKLVQVYLSKRLTVNFGRDDQGEAKTIVLEEGFQEVEQEVAEHWFVKAHLKEFTSNDSSSHALQNELDAANAAIESLTTQSEAATAKINQLTDDLKNRDKDVADLKSSWQRRSKPNPKRQNQPIHLQTLRLKQKVNDHDY